MEPSPPRLALAAVVVRRGPGVVLDIDALAVHPGEVLAVLGPNGAGKSTLLHICGFLLRPTQGQVLLDGRPVHGTPLWARRRAALLLQHPVLYRGSVLANVELGLRLHGAPRQGRRQQALGWLGRFGVEDLAGRSGQALSGGEVQRVALARALALEPDIVLLDEPFTGLDQPTREELVSATITELRRLHATTVFVTHDRAEALAMADRVVILAQGRVRQLGSPAEVRAHPADALVAAYIGAGSRESGTA